MSAALKRIEEVDWTKVPPGEAANMLMNIFGQDPEVGSRHPLVKVALFRIREALARVGNAVDGVFICPHEGGRGAGFTPHEGGPGVVGQASFDSSASGAGNV